MDSLTNQLSNVSLYDMKAYVRKAQNAVLNFSDMEAKVREATNNEPWGTPTSKMQEIADGTNNYQQFHEIMPFIYRRFTEKSASEWRQIYKALQLLDYLVRNGSERVVDYARSHISVIEMLRHFSYVDHRGTDHGISIRKRADELVKLLGSTKNLRIERKRAQKFSKKIGTFSGSSDPFRGSHISDSNANRQDMLRHQFGDDYRFDSAGPGASHDDDFEEYDAGDSADVGSSASHVDAATDAVAATADDDDDFADFQTAPTAEATTASSSKPLTSSNILDLFDVPVAPAATQPPGASFAAAPQPAATASSQAAFGQSSTPLFTTALSGAQVPPPSAAPKKAPVDDIFGSLWESSKSADSTALKPATPTASKAATTLASNGSSSSAAASAPSAPAQGGNAGGDVDLLSF